MPGQEKCNCKGGNSTMLLKTDEIQCLDNIQETKMYVLIFNSN